MIKVLDNGYIKHIESWGVGESGILESAIIEAARQSTQGSFRGWEKDEKLLRFLIDNKHFSPLEFCGMTLEVKLPIFVIREWHRHRSKSFNEASARYGVLPDENYMPTLERLFLTQDNNTQAQSLKGSMELTEESALAWLDALEEAYRVSEDVYQLGLKLGVPKEVARTIMPVGRYTKMRVSANLRNWLAFLTLRMHPDAQYEIRMYANTVGDIISNEFPRTWNIFSEIKEL